MCVSIIANNLIVRGTSCAETADISVVSQLTELSCSILTDIKNRFAPYRRADYTRDSSTIIARATAEGIGFFTSSLPVLIQGVFDYLETGSSAYPGWKLTAGQKYPRFLRDIFLHIYTEEKGTELYGIAIDSLYQLSVFTKKLSGDYKVGYIKKAYRQFHLVDHSLSSVFENLDNQAFEILDIARRFTRDFSDGLSLDLRACKPCPGPGATNAKTLKSERYMPNQFFQQHQESFPYEDWFYSHPYDLVSEACCEPKSFRKLKANAKHEPTARFQFVPKTYNKARGICIEENESQYLQQALANLLRWQVDRRYHGHVIFNDQTINQQLALVSSALMNYATIDMSEASDRIARDIVSWMFQDNSEIHNALMALSTRWVEVPKEAEYCSKHRLQKYAAMGSALCFPIMALVHYNLIRAIVLKIHHVDIRKELWVYGDDIVLPCKYAQTVFDELPKFGMKLNRNKSFTKSLFRESCGVHAYNGRDITPVYLRKILINGKLDTLVSNFATEYLLFKKGFTKTAECLRRIACKVYMGYIPYIPVQTALFGWKRPYSYFPKTIGFLPDSNCEKRWVSRFQSYAYKVKVLVDFCLEPEVKLKAEHQGLLRWHLQNTRKSLNFRDSSTVQIVKWKWTLESAIRG